jgi:multiple sugar transport system permease protein
MTPSASPRGDARRLGRRLFEPRRLDMLAPIPKVVTYAALALWSLVVLTPIYWVFITSFKLPIQVDGGPYYLPFIDFRPSLDAWDYIFFGLGKDTLRPYVNSVIVSVGSTLLSVLIGSLAAYALVRIRFRVKLASVAAFLALIAGIVTAVAALGVPWQIALAAAAALFLLFISTAGRRFQAAANNNDIEFWIISNRILPPVVAVLPVYLMFQQLRLLDTHIALIATYTAVNLPIVVWLMRDFFASVPLDLEESAEIDGASKYRVFFTIALPLVRSGLVATFLLVLILSWNEYLWALVLSNANSQTMPILVSAQNGTRGPQWWYMSALIVIMIAPVVTIAIVLQKHIARGLLIGAVKG